MHLFKPKYKLPSGEYSESRNWAVKYVRDGKQIVKSLKTPNKATATKRAKDLVRAIDEKGWDAIKPILPGAKRTPIDELLKAYEVFSFEFRRRKLRLSTVKDNQIALLQVARAAGAKFVEQLEGKFDVWRRSKPELKPATVNATLRKCKSIFSEESMQYYQKIGIFTVNPFGNDYPVEEEEIPFLGYEMGKISRLWKNAGTELKGQDNGAYILFSLCLFAGLRQQEALWSRWQDLRDKGIYVRSDFEHKTKTDKGRFVHLPQEIVAELRDLQSNPHPLMIPPMKLDSKTGKGERRGKAVARRLGKWILKQGIIKVDKPIHELRKVFGSLIATEHGIYAAKELLGHSTISVTERIYAAYLKQPTVNLQALTNS